MLYTYSVLSVLFYSRFIIKHILVTAIEPNCNGTQGAICQIPSLCQEEWTFGANRCYKLVSSSTSYREATWLCNLNKGFLPVIISTAENQYINSFYSDGKWLGYDDFIEEGTFRWNDDIKTSVTTTYWNTGEPNDSGNNEDCSSAVSNSWNDVRCTSSYAAVCEMDLTPRQWYPWRKSMYLFTKQLMDWNELEASCEAVGAYMIVVNNNDENEFIISIMSALVVGPGRTMYIGLLEKSDGTYEWPDSGEYSSFTSWDSGEPNSADQLTTGLRLSSTRWDDIYSSGKYYSACEKGIEWEYFGNSKYFATEYRMDVGNARQRCQDIGGDLATITTEEENEFIIDMITNIHISGISFYIGYQSDSLSTWTWLDDSMSGYANWAPSEGNTASACACLDHAIGQWLDVSCTTVLGFICEAEIEWQPWRNAKYYINTTPLPYIKAIETCQKLGGDVVAYDSVEEQNFVENLLQQTTVITSQYRCVYIDWCSSQPNTGCAPGTCTEYVSNSDSYSDVSCTKHRASVCKTDLKPADGNLWERRMYFAVTISAIYTTAATKCDGMGMGMASITSQNEQNVVIDVLTQSNVQLALIGYTDILAEGEYVWDSTSKQVTGFEAWNTVNPLFGDHIDCTIIERDTQTWKAQSCSSAYHYVCEFVGADNYIFVKDGVGAALTPDIRNSCVAGHTLEEMKTRSLIECMSFCLLKNGCVSINYYSTRRIENCQLNEITRSEFPNDVFTLSTCDYYDLK